MPKLNFNLRSEKNKEDEIKEDNQLDDPCVSNFNSNQIVSSSQENKIRALMKNTRIFKIIITESIRA